MGQNPTLILFSLKQFRCTTSLEYFLCRHFYSLETQQQTLTVSGFGKFEITGWRYIKNGIVIFGCLKSPVPFCMLKIETSQNYLEPSQKERASKWHFQLFCLVWLTERSLANQFFITLFVSWLIFGITDPYFTISAEPKLFKAAM